MITAVDTSVLIDVLFADPRHGQQSLARLRKSFNEGSLVICGIVYAELAPRFPSKRELDQTLSDHGIALVSMGAEAAYLAGRQWLLYRQAGGPHDRALPDFLIGAHALLTADRLLTRDGGFYREYFADLALLE